MQKKFGFSLIRVAAALVLLTALIAVGGLWTLWRMYNRSVRATAAMSVLNIGRLITVHLAEQPVVRKGEDESEDWSAFSRLARSLHRIESGLQFVSVTRDGATVFHEQITEPDDSGPGVHEKLEDAELTIGRQLIMFGSSCIPVVTFTLHPEAEDAGFDSIQVGIRKEAVDPEEMLPSLAVKFMFRVSLITVILSFGVCLVVVVVMMRRELAVEERRRRQEHLAFAGVMANGIVHDFRNPMSSLNLDVQMLNRAAEKEGPPDSSRISGLSRRICDTLERMDKVFQEFLYLSKPSPRTDEDCDLMAVVMECVDFLKPRLNRSAVGLELTPPDESLPVKCSGVSLGRAIINIITNAEHFSPENGVVRVKCFRDGKNAVVDITDEGPGVASPDKPKVFDMFFSKRPQGTGMGLFLARTAIENCKGRIEIMDGSRKGAWFRIILPLTRISHSQ